MEPRHATSPGELRRTGTDELRARFPVGDLLAAGYRAATTPARANFVLYS